MTLSAPTYRHCERSEAIQRREMDCFATLAMTCLKEALA